MGRLTGALGKLLSFIRVTKNDAKVSDVKLNPGGGPTVTAEHFSAPGDDSNPLPGDYLITVPIQRSGGSGVVGYLDPKSDQKTQAGEKRIYARDSAGASIVELWLKNDGTAILSNDNGFIVLQSDGTVDINGVQITPSGDIITASGVSLDNHTHTQPNDSGGNTEQPTAAPTPTP